MPFCRSTQFTDLACFGPPTSSVPGVATPLESVNPEAFKARETCCWSGRDCDDSGPRVTTLLSSCALLSKLSACFRPSRRSTMKNHHHAPECRFASLYGRSGTEKPRLEKNLPPPKPEHVVLPNVAQHPKNHTSSFAISRTRLAALPWDLRLAIGRRRRELHLRKSVLDSHLQ